MSKNIYLTEAENEALVLLSKGFNTSQVYQKCDVPPSGMSFFLAEIRRKTGIQDIKYPKECRQYQEKYEQAFANFSSISKENLHFMERILEGETPEALAYREKTTEPHVLMRAESLYRAMGIFSTESRARAFQIRLFLAVHNPKNLVIGLSDYDLRHIQLFGEGLSYPEIAAKIMEEQGYESPRTRMTVKVGCMMLNLTMRGRNTQRLLVSAYFRALDILKNNVPTMDDPAF